MPRPNTLSLPNTFPHWNELKVHGEKVTFFFRISDWHFRRVHLQFSFQVNIFTLIDGASKVSAEIRWRCCPTPTSTGKFGDVKS